MFLTEIKHLQAVAELDLVVFDVIEQLRTRDFRKVARRIANGGTSYDPVWQAITPSHRAIIVLTDGYATFPPPKQICLPVLWAMTTDIKPPFGWIGRIKEI